MPSTLRKKALENLIVKSALIILVVIYEAVFPLWVLGLIYRIATKRSLPEDIETLIDHY